MNDISKAIDHLELVSKSLDRAASKPGIADTSYGLMLEHMSYGLFSQAQDLKSLYGVYTGELGDAA